MKKFNFIYIIALNLFFISLNADNIFVHNMTHSPVFVATYYLQGKTANKVGNPKKILPQQKIKIPRPKKKFRFDRKIIFSFKKQDLKATLEGASFRNSSNINIGIMNGKIFYLAIKGENLKGYNAVQWKIIKPTLKLLSKPIKQILSVTRDKIYTNPHSKDIARVRISSDICQEEKNYLKKRRPIVKKAIEKFTSTSFEDNQTPTIAFCCSGGGYRAMIATAGILSGAEKTGLLDCTSYGAGLSGSTWFMAPWLYSEISVANYNKKLQKIVAKDLKKTFIDPIIITKQLTKKHIFNQPVSSVDLYGAILANKLFENLKKSKRLNTHLSDLTKNIKNGQNFFPIFTAVQPGPPFSWFEFTPYQFGQSIGKNFIQTWSLGRKFINGKSQDFAPEQSLGYFMGIWGSAFTISFKEAINQLGSKMPTKIKNYAKKYIKNWGREEGRVSPAKLYNPTYGINTEFGKMRKLTLIDAGLDFNLPFPPLLRPKRAVDIIIICDVSANAQNRAPAVKKAEKWAKKNNLKFPKINYKIIGKNIISVFKNETDNEVPTIIYMSLVKNLKFNKQFNPVDEIKNGFCNTFNFKYTPKQFELLSGLMEHNITESIEIIKKEIISKIESKKTIKTNIEDEVEYTEDEYTKEFEKLLNLKIKLEKEIEKFKKLNLEIQNRNRIIDRTIY